MRGRALRPLREPLVTESWVSPSLTPVARCHPSAGCSRGCRWRNPPPPACRPSSRSRCLRDGGVSWGSGGPEGAWGLTHLQSRQPDPAPPCHAVSTGSSPHPGPPAQPWVPPWPPPRAPARPYPPVRRMLSPEGPGQVRPPVRGTPAPRAAPGRALPSPPTPGPSCPCPRTAPRYPGPAPPSPGAAPGDAGPGRAPALTGDPADDPEVDATLGQAEAGGHQRGVAGLQQRRPPLPPCPPQRRRPPPRRHSAPRFRPDSLARRTRPDRKPHVGARAHVAPGVPAPLPRMERRRAPTAPPRYGRRRFWDALYQREGAETREWLGGLSRFLPQLEPELRPGDRILVLGTCPVPGMPGVPGGGRAGGARGPAGGCAVGSRQGAVWHRAGTVSCAQPGPAGRPRCRGCWPAAGGYNRPVIPPAV